MFKVTLCSFMQDLGTRRYLVAQRDVELPVAPFIGLEIFITDVIRTRIAEVIYDVNTGEWEASEKDGTIHPPAEQKAATLGLPVETLEDHLESLQEAGFQVEIHSFDDDPPPTRRHLRLVSDEG